MKNDRIAVALLGAGRIGQEHAKNLAAFPQVEVVVVCDPRIEGAETLRPLVRARDVTPSPEEAVNRNDWTLPRT
jgi:myo-inositol 2-dehydrogenase / D-chiro-inositol 1-dehydrogenase